MMLKIWKMVIFVVLLTGMAGCGGLRYSEVSPDARDFHPRRIAVFPANSAAFPEAKGDTDRLFAEVLRERKWFDDVIGGADIGRRMESDEGLRQVVTDYLAKLANVSFSDPALSGRLGELTGAEAFILVRVDSWNYAVEKDTKIAKVSLSIRMMEAKTGKTIWTAVHQRISEYLILRPNLPDVARDLIREMIGHMPR